MASWQGPLRPDEEIRQLRSHLRQRSVLVEYASQHIQHMQKALTQMNITLQHVVSDITGKTGMDIIAGECNSRELANLRDYRVKASEATIAKALQGHWRDKHLFELTQSVELYTTYQDKTPDCDRQIETLVNTFEDRSEGPMTPKIERGTRSPE